MKAVSLSLPLSGENRRKRPTGFGLEHVVDAGVRATRHTGFVERGLGLAINTADVDVVVDTVELRDAQLRLRGDVVVQACEADCRCIVSSI